MYVCNDGFLSYLTTLFQVHRFCGVEWDGKIVMKEKARPFSKLYPDIHQERAFRLVMRPRYDQGRSAFQIQV
jgi:hypothetical protein